MLRKRTDSRIPYFVTAPICFFRFMTKSGSGMENDALQKNSLNSSACTFQLLQFVSFAL